MRLITRFDVIEDIGTGFRSREVSTTIHALALQHSEEALRGRIVGATADPTHAARQMVAE
jgi:hypothetical protein